MGGTGSGIEGAAAGLGRGPQPPPLALVDSGYASPPVGFACVSYSPARTGTSLSAETNVAPTTLRSTKRTIPSGPTTNTERFTGISIPPRTP